MPTVFGVIIATYNRPGYLVEAIQSVLAQTYPHWKLFICNDSSSVDYSPADPWLKDPRIFMTRTPVNSGPNMARNIAIDLAVKEGCDYLVFMDDEDTLDPHGMEVALREIAAHPDAGWFVSNTSGDRKATQRDIRQDGYVDWFDDYVYGKSLRGDKTHIVSLKVLGDIRFEGRLRAETWHFFLPLAARTRTWAYTYPTRKIRYLDTGITKTVSRYPRSWLELYSRFAQHAVAIRLRPGKLPAYRYLVMELVKSVRRAIYLLAGKSGR